MTLEEAKGLIGKKVFYPTNKELKTIKRVKEIEYDNDTRKMVLAYLDDETICNIEILRNTEGKYISP